MPKRLFLLRHAKSDWSEPGRPDFDRPLNKRGREAAPLMGRLWREADYQVDKILCSPARRTVETFHLFEEEARTGVIPNYDAGLYETGAGLLAGRLKQCGDDIAAALLIGHNPGMEDLAAALADPMSNPAVYEKMSFKFPTAALAVLTLQIDSWGALAEGCATLESFTAPKDHDA